MPPMGIRGTFLALFAGNCLAEKVAEGHPTMQHSINSQTEAMDLTSEAQCQLQQLEEALRKHWRLGQNMVLCWAPDPRGLLTLTVPHYFLGNFTAQGADSANETFIREVIGGSRLKSHEQIFAISKRLGVSTGFIKLDEPLGEDATLLRAADAIVARYGIGYVASRAVLLFDIAEFSLYSPFEQASQLNSLSYSMNSAYNKLQREGVDVNFARTTTGDGYYVWNRDLGPYPDLDLLTFLLLVLVDNAAARQEASGNTVPVIRAAFHIGSHYELFQAEGVNPTLFSYIVGDVTIKLARLLANAEAGQVLIGDFHAPLPEEEGEHDANIFMRRVIKELTDLPNLLSGGQPLREWHLDAESCGGDQASTIEIVDKHGLRQRAFNTRFSVRLGSNELSIGVRAQTQ